MIRRRTKQAVLVILMFLTSYGLYEVLTPEEHPKALSTTSTPTLSNRWLQNNPWNYPAEWEGICYHHGKPVLDYLYMHGKNPPGWEGVPKCDIPRAEFAKAGLHKDFVYLYARWVQSKERNK